MITLVSVRSALRLMVGVEFSRHGSSTMRRRCVGGERERDELRDQPYVTEFQEVEAVGVPVFHRGVRHPAQISWASGPAAAAHLSQGADDSWLPRPLMVVVDVHLICQNQLGGTP